MLMVLAAFFGGAMGLVLIGLTLVGVLSIGDALGLAALIYGAMILRLALALTVGASPNDR